VENRRNLSSLNDLRDLYQRQEVELSTTVRLASPAFSTLTGVLCICPSSQEDGSRGTDWVHLSFQLPTDPDNNLPLMTVDPPDGDSEWSLDLLATTFGIDPDAPVWEADENI